MKAFSYQGNGRRGHLKDVCGPIMKGTLRVQGFDHCGFKLEECEDGRAVVTFASDGSLTNPMGGLHGGYLFALADTAMGMSFISTLAPGETFATVDATVQFLRPFREGTLIARAHVAKRGQRIGFVRCDIHDQDDRLIATTTATCLPIEVADD